MKFNFDKTVQVLNFFARNEVGKKMDKLELLKMIFFADRYHLLKYGRTVTGNIYYAMKQGPVPSMAKDICNLSSKVNDFEKKYALTYLRIGKNVIYSKCEYDNTRFSQSDKEALNVAKNLYYELRNQHIDIPEYTHKFFDWDNKYKPFLPNDKNKHLLMEPGEFFNLIDGDYCASIDLQVIELNRISLSI